MEIAEEKEAGRQEQADDPIAEITAMKELAESFARLPNEAAKSRVLAWANSHYGGEAPSSTKAGGSGGGAGVGASANGNAVESIRQRFTELGEFCAAANASTDVDRALIAGYWYQFVQGEPDFTGQTINTALKHLGYPVSNITTAFDSLQGRRPSLVIQLRKSGTSKQARKQYKVTVEGKRAVEQMLALAQ